MSANSANTQETLVGHFKEVYADKIKDLRPDGVELYNMAKFVEASKQGGNFYNQPIVLGYEHGFSYNGTSGAVGTLEAAVAAPHANASVIGSEIILSSYLSFGAASRSKSGKNAFIQETKHIVSNMFKSFMLRIEIILMYGQSGIAIVESTSGNTFTVEKEEWAAGIWAGSENMPIEIRTSAGVKRGDTVVTSVNMDTKTITVDGLPAGTVISDVVYHKGAYSNESVGLHKIVSNTGTLFGVDASAYSLFKGNIVDVGTNFTGSEAVLSFAKIEEAIARMQEKGLTKEEVVLLCNPQSWKNLLVDLAAKRSFDSSYSAAKLDQGASEIVFHGPNGKIRIMSTIFCKEGYAYLMCPKDFIRVGSSDVTFKQPGMDDKDMVKMLERASGYEFRAYSDQALFSASPGKTALLRYIKSA